MRTVYLFNMVTLNGLFEGAGRDISWHNVDSEFNAFAVEQLGTTDLLLFGRVTYELMAGYWPTDQAGKDDPVVAGLMNRIPKIVFSKTMDRAEWNNTRLVKDSPDREIASLKRQAGKDIGIFGSSDLAVSLANAGLIDEFRIIVNPLLLGAGKPLLQGLSNKLDLKLSNTRQFASGNMLLIYRLR